MRLDKFLSECKVCSRSQCQQLIKMGRVSINGERPQCKNQDVDPNSSAVCVDGQKIVYKKHIWLMLNKPKGFVSATQDKRQKTVLDLVPQEFKKYNLFPVGRLDKDTQGIVLLTNDGETAHKVLSPKNNHKKTYTFECADELTFDDVFKMQNGLQLSDGYVCKPCQIKLTTKTSGKITLTEGKYHQIKRMFGAVGNKILQLERIDFCGICLEGLNRGEVRILSTTEINKLTNL